MLYWTKLHVHHFVYKWLCSFILCYCDRSCEYQEETFAYILWYVGLSLLCLKSHVSVGTSTSRHLSVIVSRTISLLLRSDCVFSEVMAIDGSADRRWPVLHPCAAAAAVTGRRSCAGRHSLKVNNVFRTARGGGGGSQRTMPTVNLNWTELNLNLVWTWRPQWQLPIMAANVNRYESQSIILSIFVLQINESIHRNPQNTTNRTGQRHFTALYLYFSHKCYDWGLRAPYDLNSHGTRTVAVESHGRREIFWTFFTHRTMNRSF